MGLTYGPLSIHVLKFIVNYFGRFATAAVASHCTWIAIDNYHWWFSWHVILCTLGYLPLMAESFILFTSDEFWTRQIESKTKYILHGIITVLATVVVICGNAVEFYYATEHLKTAHGITGLVSMILIIISVAFGFLSYNSSKFRLYARPVVLKFIHNIIGLIGFLIGIASLCLAYYTDWFKFYSSENSSIALVVVTCLAALWSVHGALKSAISQLNTIVY